MYVSARTVYIYGHPEKGLNNVVLDVGLAGKNMA